MYYSQREMKFNNVEIEQPWATNRVDWKGSTKIDTLNTWYKAILRFYGSINKCFTVISKRDINMM